MKRTIILSMAGLVLLAACQKEISPVQQEKSGMTLSATVEQQTYGTKTALGTGNTVVWSKGDQVEVFNSSAQHNTYTLTGGEGTTTGVFMGDDVVSPAYAFYPASAVNSISGSVIEFNIPAVQHYGKNSFDNGANVAVAQISGSNMAFKNICGVLKLQLAGATFVKKIVITGKEKLNGTYTVDAADITPNMPCTTTEIDEEKSVTLDCGLGVRLKMEATNFYVVVPKGALSSGFTVDVIDTENNSESFVATGNTINRSVILSMPKKNVSLISYCLGGTFSVSASQKVCFSRGNLQVKLDKDGNPTSWNLADNQYTCLYKTEQGVVGKSPIETDYFRFSTDGDGADSGYRQWGIYSQGCTTTSYAGNFVDWGNNPDVIAAIGSGFHTLSKDEYYYLITIREASTVSGITARYITAIITDVSQRGIILFPDEFEWDSSTMGSTPKGINSSSVNEYTLEQFNYMQEKGVVFLPSAGFSSNGTPAGKNASTKTWLSTVTTGGIACNSHEGIVEEYGDRTRGLLVRLVKYTL